MCGLTGFLQNSIHKSTALNVLESMLKPLHHRGPDDGGVWYDENAGIGLAHRRLSIVDLSPAGHQPMDSHSNRYAFVFNGEIYNHLDLRAELHATGHAPNWRGHSDTETLLAGFDAWGIETTIKKSIGMFAFAVWDKHTRQLTLGRDRIGEKPMYYGWQGTGEQAVFLFGSELKALKPHPAFNNSINRDAVSLQLKHNYIPAPYSIYNTVFKLRPGCLLSVSLSQKDVKEWAYWSATEQAIAGVNNPFTGSTSDAIDHLETLLKSAVKQQMMADVPLGAFLSGGIDSSLIVSLMQAQSDTAIKTFTIGFNEQSYNEAVYAKAVAKHLGTEHTELYVTAQQAMDVIPRLPSLYDEPFSDSSQIPTYLVSHLAKQHVTVALSGDAGDELFCGYNRYIMTQKFWKHMSLLPIPVRHLVANLIQSIKPDNWNKLSRLIPLPHTNRPINIGDKLHKGAKVLNAESIHELYEHFTSHWTQKDQVVLNTHHTHLNVAKDNEHHSMKLNEIEFMMALDTISYLPDDILTKVDRAAMGNSLETRVPFLDHRVIEFAWQLPLVLKLHKGQSKWPLRQVLYRHVPKELIERPKMGFGVPIDDWLRGSLKDWAENLLDETRLKDEGFFNPAPIRKKWQEHLSGQHNWQYHLWDVLMFQAWLDTQ